MLSQAGDRFCSRGCTRPGVHYATCAYSRPAYEGAFPCTGCAPQPCRDGSLICDRCYGRMRALFNDIFDLQGRLHALADPMKAKVTDRVPVQASVSEPPAPVPADLLDAIRTVDVMAKLWESWGRDLSRVQNDLHVIGPVSAWMLDRHPEVDGLRSEWSVQDAVDRWGVERRDRERVLWEPEVDGEIAAFDVHEHGDRFVSQQDAAALVGESRFTIARWTRKGLLSVTKMPGPRGSRVAMYRLSEVRAVWESEGKTA
jgi:hypothetical protein